jgi:hypothetical protein
MIMMFPLTLSARLALAHAQALRVCTDRAAASGDDYDPCNDYITHYRRHMASTAPETLQ